MTVQAEASAEMWEEATLTLGHALENGTPVEPNILLGQLLGMLNITVVMKEVPRARRTANAPR